jgi:mRNA-degrading endonuclease RelE of RelBE toxin-antitoxin system
MIYVAFMAWTVTSKKKAQKQAQKLPSDIKKILARLLMEIEIAGPFRSNWQNYGPLGKNRYHCHLKKGRPTYVAVWEVIDKEIQLVEVSYVGTHEKAPY